MIKNKIAVFGTGSSAFSFVRSFSEYEILFFLDNNQEKQYSIYKGKPVLSPDIIKNTDNSKYTVVVASEFYDEISGQLKRLGLQPEKDFVYMKKLLLAKTDYFIISYMKCGRTWLRYLIGSLIEEQFKLSFEDKLIYTDCFEYKSKQPVITAYHDDNPHLKKADELTKTKSEYDNNKVIFMVRHPGDVAVSLFYHMKYRAKNYDGDINTFVKDKIPSIVEYFNIWYSNKMNVRDFLLIKYENLHSKPISELTKINDFLEFPALNQKSMNNVVENSSFSNMKKYELQTKSDNTQLNKQLAKNEKAAKVRKGKVFGYIDELDKKTIQEIEKYISDNLNAFYEY